MPKTRTTKKPPQERNLPMVWKMPDDLSSGYATNMLVQTGEQELFVSFFEMQHPVVLVPEDINKLESVNLECIAKIIVTPERLANFIEVLQKQLEAFKAKKAKAKKNGSK